MKNKAILYIRVSTDEQADKGYSLAHQEERLKKYCEINKLDVVATFKEDHSAKTFERPTFREIMAFVKKNKALVDYLLIIKWDRFSRNTKDSYQMIHEFHKLGIEVRAIEQHLDLSIPEAKLMLAFYLAAPEVENDRRALNVHNGMRRAKKEGRWVSTAPIGYLNVRDENNRPIIIPDEGKAPLVKEAFHELAQGLYSIEEVRRRIAKKGLLCSRSNFNRLIRNPIYTGKIFIASFREEEEMVAQGQHKPIIDEELFRQVQDTVNGRVPKNTSKSTCKDELPLRGFLQCARCGNTLTGSASRGKLGNRYFYYHCREGCPERFPASKANDAFVSLLKTISVKHEVMDLYYDILKHSFKENDAEKLKKLTQLQLDIDKNTVRINNAMQKFVDMELDSEEYKTIKKRYETVNISLEREKIAIEKIDSNFLKYLKGGFSFLKNVDTYYEKSTIEIKRKIVSSMLTENLIYENNELRTPKMNAVVELIMQDMNELEEIKKGKPSKKMIASRMVVPRLPISNQYISNLWKFNELKVS